MYKKEFKKGPSKCLKCFGYDDVLCTKCDCALVGLLPDLLVGYYIVEIIRLYINNFIAMLATVFVLIFREFQLVVVIYINLKVVECIQTHKSKDGFKTFY